MIVPAYLLERVSRPYVVLRVNPGGASGFPELKRWRSRWQEFTGRSAKEKKAAPKEISGYLLSFPLESSACRRGKHLIPESTIQRNQKEHRSSSCSQHSEWQAYFTRHRGALPPQWGKISARLMLFWPHLTTFKGNSQKLFPKIQNPSIETDQDRQNGLIKTLKQLQLYSM